jgi:hypothetical protein
VCALAHSERSLLWLYKHLIALRRTVPALMAGTSVPIRGRNGLPVYKRVLHDETILIVLNPLIEPRRDDCADARRVILSTRLGTRSRDGDPDLILFGCEASGSFSLSEEHLG